MRTRFCSNVLAATSIPPPISSSRTEAKSPGLRSRESSSPQTPPPRGSGNPTRSVNEDIQSSLLQQSANKVFTTTETGNMGMAHPVVQAEKIVFVLVRGRLPVVLRLAEGQTDTTSADPDMYSFGCLCYVHGLTNGQARRRPMDDHSNSALSRGMITSSHAGSPHSDQERPTTTELNDFVMV